MRFIKYWNNVDAQFSTKISVCLFVFLKYEPPPPPINVQNSDGIELWTSKVLISLSHLLYTCYTYSWWNINAIHVHLFVHGCMNLYNFAETLKCSSNKIL